MSKDCFYCRTLAEIGSGSGLEPVWHFPLSVALLGPWQFYRGYCILVLRRHATELSQLTEADRRQYLDEMSALARAIETCFRPVKMNYELLGNQVPHMHWHLFPRYADDAEVLQPVWFALERAKTDAAEDRRLRTGQLARPELVKLLQAQLGAQGAAGTRN